MPPSHMMRVIEISRPGGPDVLLPADRPVPVPGAGEIVLRVAYAGVNRPDALQRAGAYAIGLGLPFLLAALFITRSMRLMNRIKPWLGVVEKAMGALLVLVGLALITGALSAFSFWLIEAFPALGALG